MGLMTGSFGNVCILRLPEDQSLLFPRSRCPHCKRALKNAHNIPVLSFLILKGRCAFCRAPISMQYPLIEALMAAFFAFNAWFFPTSLAHVVIADILSFYLLTLSIIDYRHHIIPDELSLSLIAVGLLGAFMNPYLTGTPGMKCLESLLSGLGGGLLMLLLAWLGEKLFKKEALGGGDIKLIAGTAAALGWQGIAGPLFIGSLTGGLVAFSLILLKKKKLGETLPFGPFLSVGAYLTCLFPAWLNFLFGQIYNP